MIHLAMEDKGSGSKSSVEKIRVCLFSTVQTSGDVRLFHREAKSLARAGFDVHVVVPSDFSGTKDGVHFHAIRRAKNRFWRMLLMPWVAMWVALKTKSSIYHYHDPELIFVGAVMRWVLFKKVIFDMRESAFRLILGKEYLPKWSRKTLSFCYRVIEKVCLKGIAIVLANESIAEEYKQCYLVRNFPEVDEDIMANAMDMVERLKLPLLVYVGGVWESRGALLYVELAKRLSERGHSFRMMIIGPYEEQFGRELKAKVSELNLQDAVTVTGLLDYREAMKLTSRAAIGLSMSGPKVAPNRAICLAGKIIEYMMCGTPVLASNFEHWRSYVEGERTGMMADPANIDEIVEVCEKMLSNPSELAAMGKRGMEAVRTKYNWNVEFKVLLKCYEKLQKG